MNWMNVQQPAKLLAVRASNNLIAAKVKRSIILLAIFFLASAIAVSAQRRASRPSTAKEPEAKINIEELKNIQAVIETDRGNIILEFFPEAAPNHVASFVKLAQEGFYNGTTFHRIIKYGIIQGGDPLTKDPAKRSLYGTGGLNRLKAEFNQHKHVRGALSAVRIPGRPDSAGTQFFICVTDQPQLDGEFTVFGEVIAGIDVVTRISEVPVDDKQLATERVEVKSINIRPATAFEEPKPAPAHQVAPVIKYEPEELELTIEEMKRLRVVMETSMGEMTIEFLPEVAPNHVKHFAKYVKSGFYDGTTFSRIVPGFVIQGGDISTWPQDSPNRKRYWKKIEPIKAELNQTNFEKGVLGLAHGEDPDSGTIHFFIAVGRVSSLDGKYTAFGRVVEGLDVIDKIAAVKVDGERPLERIEIKRAYIK